MIITSTAWRKALTSNSPRSSTNFSRLSEARLQAELSRCMYSLQGFEALIRPLLGQVCQALIVVSNCIPGSPQAQAASAIIRSRSRARCSSAISPSVTKRVCHSPSLTIAAHEFVGHADGIIGVLEEDRSVGRAVERRIVTGFDQRPRLLLLFHLALDEFDDIGMVGVEHDHLGRATGLAARLDHAGGGVGGLHEGQRSRGGAAGRELLAARAQFRKIHARARSTFEDHPFVAVPAEDRLHVVFDPRMKQAEHCGLGSIPTLK